jgi:hypothetical protein
MARKLVAILVVLVACGALPALAAADSPVAMCVPSAANTAITTPNTNGTCPSGKTKKSLANQADLTAAKARITALEAKLTGVTRATVNGQPTLTFTGENIRIVNGAGITPSVNGKGNLFMGYNTTPGDQGGSHNIVVGDSNTATSYGSLVVGAKNRSRAQGEMVLGYDNGVSHKYATATGGRGNLVTGDYATVTGGAFNTATGLYASVTGGGCNIAGPGVRQFDPPCNNFDVDAFGSVTGGLENSATGPGASVSGGYASRALGTTASVSGGYGGTAANLWSSVSGGHNVRASGQFSSNLGGDTTDTPTDYSTYPSGP